MASPGTTNLHTKNPVSPIVNNGFSSADDREPNCFVCGHLVQENPFCKAHNNGSELVLLCCPDCTIQYLDSRLTSDDPRQQELRAYERNFHFFIGENKPWS